MKDIRITLDKKKKEKNDVKLLQLEVFQNEISTSKIYHTNFDIQIEIL